MYSILFSEMRKNKRKSIPKMTIKTISAILRTLGVEWPPTSQGGVAQHASIVSGHAGS
jgi:hypothetical protein